MTRVVALLLTGSFLLCTSGCSLVKVRRVSHAREPQTWPSCTEHPLYPMIDATYAALMIAATVAISRHEERDFGEGLGKAFAMSVTIPIATGLAASAIYGLVHTRRCSNARDAYDAAADKLAQ